MTSLNGLKTTVKIDLVYKAGSSNSSTAAKNQQVEYFYVFNAGKSGFVIVAGDDNVTPILGYSDEGNFKSNNIPLSVQKWLEEYKIQIRYIIENDIKASEDIQNEWQEYLTGSIENRGIRNSSVQPLIKTKWNQGQYYNTLCPYDNQYNQRTVTGCVATAMAQIMKYWNYPTTGSGFHSYNHPNYGSLSANFGNTTYQWASMPNIVNNSNNAVATLMYHCGVSVDMNYSPQSSGAAGAVKVAPALKKFFSYPSSVAVKDRVNYNTTQWINLLKEELDAGRPMYYEGTGNGSGHAFVCDGYDNNNLFHFNWGWGGNYDGYFQINALNPSGTGTGGGTGGYNSNHRAIINIQPPANTQQVDIRLYNFVTPTPVNVIIGNPIKVTTNVRNFGTNTFNGEICAALFDKYNEFVDYIQIYNSITIPSAEKFINGITFQNNTLSEELLQGTYKVGIYYRPTNGNWVLVSNDGNYKNWVDINFNNPIKDEDYIELNTPFTISPTTFIQGQSASVSVNVINKGTNTFKGIYYADLVSIDGENFQNFGPTYRESNGLPPGNRYQNPLVFNISCINVPPGTYWLRLWYGVEWEGLTISSLAGSGAFSNPIKVIVQAPPLSPDQYENNNTISQSCTLPFSFSDNKALRTTPGSNLHLGTDNDFYKINLPIGYNYTIKAKLYDSDNSEDGKQYTADALFSYSSDGNSWSDAFDLDMPDNITVQNGGTVYFHVAPYFEGITGTYLLDLSIERSQYVSCQVPTGLKATEITYSYAKLEWNAVNGASGYQTRIRSVGDNSWAESSVYVENWMKWGGIKPGKETEIQIRTRCNNNVFSDWSASVFFTTFGKDDPYCYSYGQSWDAWIAGVKVGNLIDNTTSNGYGYTRYANHGANFQVGESYHTTLTLGNEGSPKDVFWRLWIDFNGDNDFDDSGELVREYDGKGFSDNYSANFFIFIPTTAKVGPTRMRVSMNVGEYPGPCQTGNQLDVEDYIINIIQNVQPPDANFSASVTCGQAPLTVNFTDQTTNQPTSWNWVFGNGQGSTNQNPSVTYTSPGIYYVQLTSTNAAGTDVEIKNGFITVLMPVSISSTNDNICLGDTISLSAIGANEYLWSGPGFTIVQVRK
ncbi:MAG: C10 family peptidase [Saprospiraceae bacterium]|nr:C10 family peptidase [Saprospiraceae bacterium]